MPANIASSGEVFLPRLIEYAAYQLDDDKNGFFDITVAAIFHSKEPSDISVLIEGDAEKLRDRSDIWHPEGDYMLPYLLSKEGVRLRDEYRLDTYRVDRKDGNIVNAEVHGGFLEEVPIISVDLSAEKHPPDNPMYTLISFRTERKGLSLITFGYKTREGVLDIDDVEGVIWLRGAKSVAKEIDYRIGTAHKEGYEPWISHSINFLQNYLLRGIEYAGNSGDIRHILILTVPRDATISGGKVIFSPKDGKVAATDEDILTTNTSLGKIVYLSLNEEEYASAKIAKPGAFNHPISNVPQYALKP